MRKTIFLLIALVLILSGCEKEMDELAKNGKVTGEKEVEVTGSKIEESENDEKGQEQTQEQTEDEFISRILYSNLKDDASKEEVKKSLIKAGINEKSADEFLKTVTDYNETVGDVGIVDKGFVVSEELEPIYDFEKIDENWQKKYKDFVGYNCRMTTFLLADGIINVEGELEKENKVLFLDEEAMETSKNDRFTKENTAKFNTFFGDLSTELVKDTDVHLKKVKDYWKEKKVSFKEGDASVITVWFHSDLDNNLFVGHTGILVPSVVGDSLIFIEKLSFQEPYQALKFKNRTALNDYLMNKYDVSYGQEVARPFIMENDHLIEGYRFNQKNND